MDLLDLVLNGAGGAVIGPFVAQLLGGKQSSLLTRVIAGVVGGVGAGYGADAAGLGAIFGSGQAMQIVQALVEGGVGGGVLSTLAGVLLKKKA